MTQRETLLHNTFMPKMTFWCGMRQATCGSRAALYACYKQNLHETHAQLRTHNVTAPLYTVPEKNNSF